MKHLSREELIDSLEHTLPPAREAHVDTCDACRAERSSLRQVLGRVKAVDVPEPSPLFWTHFAARVSEAIVRQPQPAPSAWQAWSWPRWAVAAAAATLVVCVTLGWAGWREYQRGHLAGAVVAAHGPASHAAELAGAADISSDEDWNLVVSMAEDVSLEDVDDAAEAAMVVRPGAADRVMADLSSEQRTELARLLTAEMSRPAS